LQSLVRGLVSRLDTQQIFENASGPVGFVPHCVKVREIKIRLIEIRGELNAGFELSFSS
jgi:hypothetical protein